MDYINNTFYFDSSMSDSIIILFYGRIYSENTDKSNKENIDMAKTKFKQDNNGLAKETDFSSTQKESNSVPVGTINTEKKSILSTVISWIIGLLLILSSLGFMSFSLIGGIAILITGLLFLPPIHNLLLSLSNINLHWVLKSILALGFIFYSFIAVEDQIKEEFQANRATIISDIKNKLSDKDYLGASTLTYKYNSIKEDKELNDLRKQASNGVEEARLKKEADEKKSQEIADEKAEELKKIADAKEEKRKAEMIEKEKKQKEEERLAIKNKKKELLEPSGLLNSLTMKKETICDFAGFLVTRKLEKMFKGYSHNNSGCKVKVIKENSVEIESSYSTPFKLKPTMRYTARGTVDGVMLTLDKIKIHGEDKKFISFDNFPFE